MTCNINFAPGRCRWTLMTVIALYLVVHIWSQLSSSKRSYKNKKEMYITGGHHRINIIGTGLYMQHLCLSLSLRHWNLTPHETLHEHSRMKNQWPSRLWIWWMHSINTGRHHIKYLKKNDSKFGIKLIVWYLFRKSLFVRYWWPMEAFSLILILDNVFVSTCFNVHIPSKKKTKKNIFLCFLFFFYLFAHFVRYLRNLILKCPFKMFSEYYLEHIYILDSKNQELFSLIHLEKISDSYPWYFTIYH